MVFGLKMSNDLDIKIKQINNLSQFRKTINYKIVIKYVHIVQKKNE